MTSQFDIIVIISPHIRNNYSTEIITDFFVYIKKFQVVQEKKSRVTSIIVIK